MFNLTLLGNSLNNSDTVINKNFLFHVQWPPKPGQAHPGTITSPGPPLPTFGSFHFPFNILWSLIDPDSQGFMPCPPTPIPPPPTLCDLFMSGYISLPVSFIIFYLDTTIEVKYGSDHVGTENLPDMLKKCQIKLFVSLLTNLEYLFARNTRLCNSLLSSPIFRCNIKYLN